MNNYVNTCESDLSAILQQHYRRFIASIEFVRLEPDHSGESGKIAIDIFFTDGTKERLIGKGINNETSGNLSHVA